MNARPRISIITVTFNAEAVLERTLRSVRDQTYRNIEHLLIDGQSRDRTLAVAGRYRDQLARIVSEPDRGLYDAMNKGLALATGDYVWFLNAGDEIFDAATLERVVEDGPAWPDAWYGETLLVNEDGSPHGTRSERTTRRLPAHADWQSFRYGMSICHQSFLARRDRAVTYDLRYPVASDIDWMIRTLKSCRHVVHTGRILSRFLLGGLSTRKNRQALSERFAILSRHYGFLPTLFRHGPITFRAAWKARDSSLEA